MKYRCIKGVRKIPGGGDKILRDEEETKYKVVLNPGGGEGGASITFLNEFKFATGLGSGVSSNISAEIII